MRMKNRKLERILVVVLSLALAGSVGFLIMGYVDSKNHPCVPGYSRSGPTAENQRRIISKRMTMARNEKAFYTGSRLHWESGVFDDRGSWGDGKKDWFEMSGFVKEIMKCDNPDLVGTKLPETKPSGILASYVSNRFPEVPNQAEVDAMNAYLKSIAGQIQFTQLSFSPLDN